MYVCGFHSIYELVAAIGSYTCLVVLEVIACMRKEVLLPIGKVYFKFYKTKYIQHIHITNQSTVLYYIPIFSSVIVSSVVSALTVISLTPFK